MYKTLLATAGFIAYASGAPLSQTSTAKPAAALRRATGGVVTGSAAVTTINDNDGTAGSDSYTLYTGDGSSWPSKDQWQSFDTMFNANQALMSQSCSQFGQANDSDDEINNIRSAIESVAATTQLDHRFILAAMMQESGGCVRAPTTNFGVRNPGLMQDHDGDGTCNSDVTGEISNPCPSDEITLMISEGSAGTNAGDGLAAVVNQAQSTYGVQDARAYYVGARIYNSGSVDPSGDLGAGGSTHCYASDLANRLMGWVFAPHGCNL